MKRSNRILVFFTALAVTFGTLYAFAGKENFNRGGFYRHGWHHHYDRGDCNGWGKEKADSSSLRDR